MTFVNITDPYGDEPQPEHQDADTSNPQLEASSEGYLPFDTLHASHGLAALSAAASGETFAYPSMYAQHAGASEPYLQPLQSSPLQNLNFILNQSSPELASAAIDPRLQADLRSSPESSALNDDDVPFLLRHFSEGPGHWMDLFDLGRFFEMDVPVKATSCSLLLYGAVALSAKALGRGLRTGRGVENSRPSYSASQWLHKARTYYDQAIGLLRQALAEEVRPQSSHRRTGSMSSTRSAREGSISQILPKADSDELVGTTAILCVYEFLDASGSEWSRHLDGAKTLFDIAKEGVMAMPINPPGALASPALGARSSKTRIAVFWNIVRQDMLDAFINQTSTRLNTADIPMWQNAGLHIDDSGSIIPSNDTIRHEAMQDDMICNALIWLTMKLVNFVAAKKDQSFESDLRQKQLLEYWESLNDQYRAWADGLPDGFRPSAITWPDAAKVCLLKSRKIYSD